MPLIILWAYLQYRHHGYAATENALVIRRGFVRRMTWYIPIDKFHVFYLTQSIFQRRLRLKTLFVDTAGASTIHFPMIVDLPAREADELMRRLYDRFQGVDAPRSTILPPPTTAEGSRDPGTERQAPSSASPDPAGQSPSS
ncbi:MAG: PH domain-containing protein [Rhodothermales bacterium]|nr:PH domain-containing protein [Rhodothermales bacterium]